MSKKTNGTNPNDIILEEEFNWSQYQKDIIFKCVNKYGSLERAIVEMDAVIASLRVHNEGLKEMITWNDDDEEEG